MLRRLLAFLWPPCDCAAERARCVVMVQAEAERQRLRGLTGFAADLTALANRMQVGR